MRYFRIRNFEKHQHYKNRRPPWIKLHAEVLDDYEFLCLQDASKAHLMLLWVLASKLDNQIPWDSAFIASKLGTTTEIDLEELAQQGFIEPLPGDDSSALAPHKQSALPEVETELEAKTKTERGIKSETGVLARDAIARFLEKFYRGATPERRTEVEQQLAASLSPKGARIRKGEYVIARSAGHLAKCMQQVIDNPPDKPNAAIVWVLQKLKDPELDSRGHTVTEAASEQTKAIERQERRYHAAKEKAAFAWSKENPDEADVLERRALEEFPGEMQIAEVMRTQWILERIAEKLFFPDFEEWTAESTRQHVTA